MSSPAPFIIRKATPDDAEQLLDHVKRISEEPDIFIPMAPGEFKMTVEEERKFLADVAASENSVFLVAESEGEIVGLCDCLGPRRVMMRHAVTLGINVRREWRGRGVGTALMNAALEWARASEIVKRIELRVYACNPAVKLYERFGFKIEGRHPNAVYQRGKFEDLLTMALLLP